MKETMWNSLKMVMFSRWPSIAYIISNNVKDKKKFFWRESEVASISDFFNLILTTSSTHALGI